MPTRKMHQTTVRFSADLWAALERDSAELGVSVAQFVREAALARLMYVAGRRDDPRYGTALESARGDLPPAPTPEVPPAFQDSAALWAQGRQARRHARELRSSITRGRSGY
jgi:hypothetical protein